MSCAPVCKCLSILPLQCLQSLFVLYSLLLLIPFSSLSVFFSSSEVKHPVEDTKILKKIFFPCFLHSTSLFSGGSVYWQRENKPPADHFSDFYSRAPSAEIEMTSYVLLAMLNRTKLTPEDLSYISRIVYWLIKQQNPYGGFSSTQVTTKCGKKKVSWSSTVCKLNLDKWQIFLTAYGFE